MATSVTTLRRSRSAKTNNNNNNSARMSNSSSNYSGVASSVLINLDVFLQKANISKQVSSTTKNERLYVVLKRNGKEIKSEITKWDKRNVAVWNQHLGIQTKLIRIPRNSQTNSMNTTYSMNGGTTTSMNEFMQKEYEIILVTSPSKEAIAYFMIDFSQIVQSSNGSSRNSKHKTFRLSPIKSQDMSASIEFEVKWDYANPINTTAAAAAMLGPGRRSRFISASSMEMPTTTTTSGPPKHRTSQPRKTSTSVRSVGSGGSTNDPTNPAYHNSIGDLTSVSSSTSSSIVGGSTSGKCECNKLRRRVERKERQLTQAENFLKESQKKLDSLLYENKDLRAREEAEARYSVQHRALSIRILQELEMVHSFCMERIRHDGQFDPSSTNVTLEKFLPELQVMQKIQRFHQDFQQIQQGNSTTSSTSATKEESLLLWQQFDLVQENDRALERNQLLQQHLVLLQEEFSEEIFSQSEEEKKLILTSRTRINQLERETILLRKKLQNAETLLANATSRMSTTSSTSSGNAPSSITNPSEQQEQQQQQQQQGGAGTEVTEQEEEEEEDQLTREKSSIYNQNGVGMSARVSSIRSSTIPTITSKGLGIGYAVGGLGMVPFEQDSLLKQIEELKEEKENLLDEMEMLKEEVTTLKTATSSSGGGGEGGEKGGPGFFNKVLMDTNMAKVMLEERVKVLTNQLQDAQESNTKLEQKIQLLQTNPQPPSANSDMLGLTSATIPTPSSSSSLTELQATNTKLHEEIKSLQIQLTKQSTVSSLGAMSNSRTNADDLSSTNGDPSATAIVDLQKQLKLAKQEAMQLRYRSNNLEQIHEKLEETLKEKKTLQVKLTTLEGQLFEHRSRTISISERQSQNLEKNDLLDETKKELDQKTAQLIVCKRELEFVKKELDHLKRLQTSTPLIVASTKEDEGLVEKLNEKLLSLQEKLVQLTQENQDHAKKIEVFYTNLQQTNQEKMDLQRIVDQMVMESQQLEQNIQKERQEYLNAMKEMGGFGVGGTNSKQEKRGHMIHLSTSTIPPSQSPPSTSKVSELKRAFQLFS